jgi:calcineurin-like phosphoesterase family protein
MIKIDKDIKVWITSDTHYSHQNICRGVTNWRTPSGGIPESQTRPFDTLDKMNAAIVNNINSCVGQDDILIHLGDWSFGGFENIEEFYHRLI